MYGIVLLKQRVDHKQHSHTHTHQRHAAKRKKRGGTRRGIITEIPRREVCSHTPITLATMSEEVSVRSTAASQASRASQASAGGSSSADKGRAAADPTASGEAIDEMMAANNERDKKISNPVLTIIYRPIAYEHRPMPGLSTEVEPVIQAPAVPHV